MVMPQFLKLLFCARCSQALLPSTHNLEIYSESTSFNELQFADTECQCQYSKFNTHRVCSCSIPLAILITVHHEFINVFLDIAPIAMTTVKRDQIGMELTPLSGSSQLQRTSSVDEKGIFSSSGSMVIGSSRHNRDETVEPPAPQISSSFEAGSSAQSLCDKTSEKPDNNSIKCVPISATAVKCHPSDGNGNDLICSGENYVHLACGSSSFNKQTNSNQTSVDNLESMCESDQSIVFIAPENKVRTKSFKAAQNNLRDDESLTEDKRQTLKGIYNENMHQLPYAKPGVPNESIQVSRNRPEQRNIAASADQIWPVNAKNNKRRRCTYLPTHGYTNKGRSNEWISSEPTSLSSSICLDNQKQYQASSNRNIFQRKSPTHPHLNSIHVDEDYAHSQSHPHLPFAHSSGLPSSSNSHGIHGISKGTVLSMTCDPATLNVASKTLSHPALYIHEDETTRLSAPRSIKRKNSAPIARPTSLYIPPLACKRSILSGSFDNVSIKSLKNVSLENMPLDTSIFKVENANGSMRSIDNPENDDLFSGYSSRKSDSSPFWHHHNHRYQHTNYVPTGNSSDQDPNLAFAECEEEEPLLDATSVNENSHPIPNPRHICPVLRKTLIHTPTTTIQLECPTDDEVSDKEQDPHIIIDFSNQPVDSPVSEEDIVDETVDCGISSHRKRKFRRKRSLPYIFNRFISKSKKPGKTNKLCTQRKQVEEDCQQKPTKAFNVVVTAEERYPQQHNLQYHPLNHHHYQQQQQQQHFSSQDSSPFQSTSNIFSCDPQTQSSNYQHSAYLPNHESVTPVAPRWQRGTSPHYSYRNTWAAPSRAHSPSPQRVTRVSFTHLNGHGGTREDLLDSPGSSSSRPQGLHSARAPKHYSSSRSVGSSVGTSNGCLSSSSQRPLLHPAINDLRRQEPGRPRTTTYIPRTLANDRKRRRGEFTVTPVNNETNLRDQSPGGRNVQATNLRVPVSTFDIDGEPTDTLTQNSITSLLSSKFRDVAKRWKQYGVDSPRFRKRIHSKWESMNYEETDSQLTRKNRDGKQSKKKLALEMLSSWVIFFFIGVGTAFLAAGVQISVELIAHQKFELIKDYFDTCDKEGCLFKPVLIWMGINAGITLVGAALVTYVQPMAAGSGIPLIKSYLNGVRVPGLLSLRAFIAKCVGVVLSILGGLACGKEGPMAHSGGIMAAGLGKGRIPWFGKDINLYGLFRNDHNIRDLVAAGAASGVSAAFGAPIGGTLFSVEEAASFWNTELVWKVFFSAMIACFSTNVLLSAFEGHPTQLSNPGLVRFNVFESLTFDLIEIPVFIFIAAVGGLTGSLFVVMNYKLTVFRQKYLHRKKWIKVLEAGLVSAVSAVAAFLLMFSVNDCTESHPYSHHAITTKLGCSGDKHNSMSTMFLTTPEGCLKSLLHDPVDMYSVWSLVLFVVVFFLLGVWTYGLSVSSGVFIPSLAIGAAWGRLVGLGVVELFPDQAKDVGKYALIGAASQLGGILRTTISLTVIIVECTGDITFGLCIMISLMISKWVGDFFTTGLYDMNVEVSGIPLLSWEPPPLCEDVHVSDFMSQPVMTLLGIERVGHIYDCLSGESFNGFPIIEQDPNYDLMYRGKLKGIILRHQLLVLLKKKMFCPEGQMPSATVHLKDFDNPYPVPQRLKIQDIELTDADKQCVMDLTPYMHLTPYTASISFSMPRVFRLFRGLGLRHLVVVNENTEPIGMVTRKDLAKYRAEIKKGMLHMEQLTVENR